METKHEKYTQTRSPQKYNNTNERKKMILVSKSTTKNIKGRRREKEVKERMKIITMKREKRLEWISLYKPNKILTR